MQNENSPETEKSRECKTRNKQCVEDGAAAIHLTSKAVPGEYLLATITGQGRQIS